MKKKGNKEEIKVLPGNYFIQVFIQETNSLSVEESNDTLDVVIEIEIFDQKKKTLKKKGVGFGTAAYYGEHFYFQKKLETIQSVEDSQLIIRVYDEKLLTTLIGTTSLSIAEIYRSKNHVVEHKWMCLSNIEIDYQRIMGYLKLSCNVTRDVDERVLLQGEALNAKKIQNLSIPPKFKPKQMQIMINVHEANRLVGLDSVLFSDEKTSDPYVEAVFGADRIRTSVKDNAKTRAVFRESLVISTIYPTLVSSLKLTLYDYDSFKSDDVFGAQTLKIPDIVKKKYKEGHWLYFYGAHDFAPISEAKDKMNEYPELASAFKGALYVVIDLIPLEGKFGTFCRGINRDEFIVPPPLKQYRVRFEIFSVQQVIYKTKKFNTNKHKVVINWGGNIKETKTVRLKDGIIPVYTYVDIIEKFATSKLEQTPDIIISLVNVEKNLYVSFCRLRPEEFIIDKDIKDRYMMLNVDKSFTDNLRDDTAGILHLKIGVGDNIDGHEFSEFPLFNQQCLEPPLRSVVIIINIIQAKSLPSADEDGTADPFIVISHYGNNAKSSIINDTLNPIWNERVFLKSQVVGGFFSPVVINAYDHDESGPAEFLGSTSLFLDETDLVEEVGFIPKPGWLDLKYTKKIVIGKIKISASVVDVKNTAFIQEGIPKKPLKIFQKLEEFHLKLKVLGLRNLKTDGMSSIKKPYVKIEIPHYDMSSGDYVLKKKIQKIKTVTTGDNPNIGQILNFDVTLPKNDSMKPTIGCKVYDESNFGKDKFIGYFEINLGFFSRATKKTLIRQLKKVGKKISENKLHEGNKQAIQRIIDQLVHATTLKSSKRLEKRKRMTVVLTGRETKRGIGSNTRMESSDTKLMPRINRKNQKKLIGTNKILMESLSHILHKNSVNSVPAIIHTGKESDYIFEEDTDSEFDIEEDFEEEMRENEKVKKAGKKNVSNMKAVIMPIYKEEKKNFFERMKSKKKDKRKTKEAVEKYDEEQNLINCGNRSSKRIGKKSKLVEIRKPDLKYYKPVGYDTISTKNKHYRLQIGQPLEESEFKGKSEFQSLVIRKGKRINIDLNWYEKMLLKEKQSKNVGLFKGSTSCISKNLLSRLNRIKLVSEFNEFDIPYSKETWENRKLDKDLLQKVELVTRVYVLDGVIYENYDTESKTDPFLKIILGDIVISDENNSINDRQRPIFNKKFDIKHSLPGASILRIEIWDKDVVADELIGETWIDLENRFYNESYRSMEHQPIEERKLYMGNSGKELGILNLWIEMIPAGKENKKTIKNHEIWDITSIPAKEFELRVIVWEVKNAPGVDFDGSSDLFVQVNLNSLNQNLAEKTDVHSRATGGFGSFNWRMKFPITIDEYSISPEERKKYRLDFQIWDSDFGSGNDFLSSATISFWNLIQEAMTTEKRTKMHKKSGLRNLDEFYITTVPNDTFLLMPTYKPSKIKISVELIPKKEAEKNPVGSGRSDPNQDPFLPAPVGRSSFTMNPYEIMMRKVGMTPGDMKMMTCYGILGFCCCLILLIFCVIVGYIIGRWLYGD